MIKRRFENTDFSIKAIPINRLMVGFFIGVFVAVFAYCFFNIFTEVFRVLQLEMSERNGIIKFSNSEQYWFNFLGSGIGVILGNSAFILYCISKPQRVFGKYSTKWKRVVNDQIFLSFNFVYWFVKVAYFIGLMVAAFMDFEFIKFYYYAFLLLLIVLYLESWKALSQVVKKNRLRIQSIHFIVLFVSALALSSYNPVDHNRITSILETSNPTIKLPISEYNKENIGMMRSILKLSKRDDDYFVIDGAGSNGIFLQGFSDYLNDNQYHKKRAEFSTIYLMADNNTPMKIIKELEGILRVHGYFRIMYVTANSITKGIELYPRNGVFRGIPIPDYTKHKKGKLLPPSPPSVFDEEKYKFISVIIKDFYSVGNEKNLDRNELIEVFESRIDSNMVFQYEYSENISYQKYIDVLSAHKQAIFNKKKAEGLFLMEESCHDNYIDDDQFESCYIEAQKEAKRLRNKFPFLIKEQIRD